MKEIKTKSVAKDIKVLVKTAGASGRMKNACIRTKDKAEKLGHNDDSNYVEEAENSIGGGMEGLIRTTGYAAENYGKKWIGKTGERRAPDISSSRSGTADGEYGRQAPNSGRKEAAHQNAASAERKQAAKRNAFPPEFKSAVNKSASRHIPEPGAKPKVIRSGAKPTAKRKYILSRSGMRAKRRLIQNRRKQRFSKAGEILTANQGFNAMESQQISRRIPRQHFPFQRTGRTPVQTLYASGKTETAITGGRAVKKSVKGAVKTVQKPVKAAGRKAKAAVKAPREAAKAAVNAAHKAQRAVQAARMAARAAVSAKMALKAVMAALKAMIAGAKGLIALIIAGGWTAFAIILVICLAGLFTSSVFGIFYSNEDSGKNTPVMEEIVGQLNQEFTEELERIQDENPHDTLEMSGGSTVIGNWRDILGVYAVKVAADPEKGMEVATLDDAKIAILRNIFWDMNKISHRIETVASTDDGGGPGETVVTTEIVLHIDLTSKCYTDMIDEYAFNGEQSEMLNELMQDKYRQLFMRLIGSRGKPRQIIYFYPKAV